MYNPDQPNPDQPGGSPRKHMRTIAGHEVLFDREGFLWASGDWNKEIAEALAQESGLASLEEDHWRVICFLREFYDYNGRAPLNRELTKGSSLSLLQIERLFPDGIKRGARRIAGLPNPKNCL
ncbi:MAG: TusE/DsrC/DsvC family sulfur relay protein [Dethiobacteria bacterium]